MATTDSDFITLTELTKLIPSDNCYGWSPTITRMVTRGWVKFILSKSLKELPNKEGDEEFMS